MGIEKPSYPAGGTRSWGNPGAGGGSATNPDIIRYWITSEIVSGYRQENIPCITKFNSQIFSIFPIFYC